MLEEKNNQLSVLYLHGRPSAHPVHTKLAKAITNQFRYVDTPIRWQDKKYPTAVNFLIWITNAIIFKNKKKYDLFLLDNLHVTPILMKILGLITKKQKLVVHLGSHTLYFMYSGKFSYLNIQLHKFALRRYDAIICEGKMAEDFCKHLLGKKCPPTYVTFLGPLTNRNELLIKCTPDFNTYKILIIASGPTEFRKFYKGLDIMIGAFNIAWQLNHKLQLHILGLWDPEIIKECLSQLPASVVNSIHFEGNRNDVEYFFSNVALNLHCARGDAFPTSTIEAMAAGLPTIVSELTGTKEVVEQVNLDLVVPLDAQTIADKINWYFNLSKTEMQQLSNKGREIVKNYTEEKAITHYQWVFKQIIKNVGLAEQTI